MNLKYKILAVLAAGIALTACGSSGAPASTPASSAVPASSHVAEEGVTEPINMLTWTLDDLDRGGYGHLYSGGDHLWCAGWQPDRKNLQL